MTRAGLRIGLLGSFLVKATQLFYAEFHGGTPAACFGRGCFKLFRVFETTLGFYKFEISSNWPLSGWKTTCGEQTITPNPIMMLPGPWLATKGPFWAPLCEAQMTVWRWKLAKVRQFAHGASNVPSIRAKPSLANLLCHFGRQNHDFGLEVCALVFPHLVHCAFKAPFIKGQVAPRRTPRQSTASLLAILGAQKEAAGDFAWDMHNLSSSPKHVLKHFPGVRKRGVLLKGVG
jgi:hypothetical protein